MFFSLNWPPCLRFFDQFPANFEALFRINQHLSNFFKWEKDFYFILYSTAIFLAITATAWVWGLRLFSDKKMKTNRFINPPSNFGSEINRYSTRRRRISGSIDFGINGEKVFASDAEFAEELQFQEALMASLLLSDTSSSVQQPILDTENSSQILCEICLENKESRKMFRNDKCPHRFCYDCTTKHVVSKIQENAKKITCPAFNCPAVLNVDACRMMIPTDALVKWDETLCASLFPESQKLYCPFRDCSTMLVNDSEVGVKKTECVACKRSFCVECRVPWHLEFTCEEFKKLGSEKGGKGDKMVKVLAQKKNWQKCPKCKIFVEKIDGCLHITCRCGYEFCYRCGSKWSELHGTCRQK